MTATLFASCKKKYIVRFQYDTTMGVLKGSNYEEETFSSKNDTMAFKKAIKMLREKENAPNAKPYTGFSLFLFKTKSSVQIDEELKRTLAERALQ